MGMTEKLLLILIGLAFGVNAGLCQSDTLTIRGSVCDSNGSPLAGSTVIYSCASPRDADQVIACDEAGKFLVSSLLASCESHFLIVSASGFQNDSIRLVPNTSLQDVRILLSPTLVTLDEATISEDAALSIGALNSLQGGGLYRGIKSAILQPAKSLGLGGETQARNIFIGIPSANIWESDAAGLQLSVGVRGLSPNRSAHMSIRQGNHPIAADPLGYPEAYYTPPLNMVEDIRLTTGASALQYGSQLGGMMNFNLRSGKWNSTPKVHGIITSIFYAPQDGMVNSNQNYFLEASGGGESASWLAAADHKSGESWRANTRFESSVVTLNGKQKWQGENGGKWGLEERFTAMRRTEQQPGGLTDQQQDNQPRASFRDRNWFDVAWNIASADVSYLPTNNGIEFNLSTYALTASRRSLGFLGTPNRIDYGLERDLIWGDFTSSGVDARGTKRWVLPEKDLIHALVFGIQGYRGRNRARQGVGSTGDGPDFNFMRTPGVDDGSDYELPNDQRSVFAQGIIALSPELSITPGLRFENILTQANGTYYVAVQDGAGNVIEDSVFSSLKRNRRSFLLPGLGFSYKHNDFELYGNAVSNYRAVNYSDIQLNNLGVQIDPSLTDEQGANFDLGFRLETPHSFFDFSVFSLLYSNKIGLLATTVPDPNIIEKPILLRTNIADAVSYGFEAAGQRLIQHSERHSTRFTGSFSWLHGEYQKGPNEALTGNRVEFMPDFIWRASILHQSKHWRFQVFGQYTGEQFTEATNSTYTSSALHGLIPAFAICDLSIGRQIKKNWTFGIKVNNVTNNNYFTRRALAYPGPGILPADGINARVTLIYQSN